MKPRVPLHANESEEDELAPRVAPPKAKATFKKRNVKSQTKPKVVRASFEDDEDEEEGAVFKLKKSGNMSIHARRKKNLDVQPLAVADAKKNYLDDLKKENEKYISPNDESKEPKEEDKTIMEDESFIPVGADREIIDVDREEIVIDDDASDAIVIEEEAPESSESDDEWFLSQLRKTAGARSTQVVAAETSRIPEMVPVIGAQAMSDQLNQLRDMLQAESEKIKHEIDSAQATLDEITHQQQQLQTSINATALQVEEAHQKIQESRVQQS